MYAMPRRASHPGLPHLIERSSSAPHRGGLAATGSALAPALALSAAALLVSAAVLVFTGRKNSTHA